MPAISASIVVYNGWEEAVVAARSVLEYAPADFILYLIDNNSPDGSAEQLRSAAAELGERVQVLCLPRNIGFGGGHNSVLPLLKSSYHFVLNPDIQVDSDVMAGMTAWMDQHPEVVMATPQLYFPDGTVQNLPRRKPNCMALVARSFPGIGCLRRFDRHYTMQDEDLTVPRPIQFCTGSFFVIRTETFRQMQGFDESYFMYVEDADLTQKALAFGQVYLLPQFRAIHAWHRNPHRDAGHFLLQLKSMLRFFSKWGFRFCS